MVKIIINYKDCFWADSELEKIEVDYDKIIITIFNDVWQKNITIECCQCAGMTQFINWDEVIIDNILLEEIFDGNHPIIKKIKQIYGRESFEFEKSIEGRFYELRILFINELSFSVICKNICFRD